MRHIGFRNNSCLLKTFPYTYSQKMEIHPFALQQGPYGIPQGNIGIVSINPAQFNNVGEEYEEGEYINENYGYEEGGYDLVPGHLGQKQNMDNQADYDRERDRDRSRRRDRDRDGRRRDDSRSSHERDRNRRRDRDRDRDRDRGRDRRDRERSSHRSSDDDRDSDSRDSFHRSDQREDRAGEKWMTDTPTNTVLLRNLPPQVEEKDIRAELMMFGAPVRDVRLMRRSTGTSRGFAFVEFQSVADAQRWMDHYQGVLNIQNHYSATMHYSTPKTQPDKGPIHKTDWTCSKCGVHNFKRRDHCFKCNLSREESERKQEGDGFDQVGTNPCNTLILRGLDALTTEDNILHVMSQISTFPLKNVQIIRDEATNTSKGFGFMELNTVNEAHQLLDQFNNRAPLEVDGKQLLVNYAKNTFSTVMATLTAAANQFGTTQDQSWGAYNQPAAVAAAQQQGYYDQSYYQGADYSQQQGGYNQYYEGTQTDSTNAAAAVAQAAINKKLASKGNPQQKKGQTKEPPQVPTQEQIASQEYPKYPPPDVSTYQYEETSGYYYDPLTTLYYDASSQYYYNAQTGQFLYWDAEKSTYLPAPTNQQGALTGGGATEGEAPTEKKKKEEKKEKNKMAKKIAKDMEKWAQSMNKQKEALKGFNAALKAMNPNDRRESATADAGYAILEKSAKGGLEDKKLMPPPSVATSSPSRAAAAGGGGKPGLVASYGGDSDEEEAGGEEDSGILDESKLTDWNKLACLLCKRQFQTKEILIKHQQMSDLHKQNLENLIKAKASAGGSDTGQFQYRDRAKERRDKYGIPPPPEPRQKRPDLPVPYEQPTKSGIGGDNIGNKLLQKMGWQAGKGLGKSGQGIVNPIEAERRAQAAGLGMRGSNYGTTTGDDYRESVKKTMFARYHEMDS